MKDPEECRTIHRLGLPPSLHRCPATANILESPHSGLRIRIRRVTHWRNGRMIRRWMASAFIRTGKCFNRIMGHRDLWALEAILNSSVIAALHFHLRAGHPLGLRTGAIP